MPPHKKKARLFLFALPAYSFSGSRGLAEGLNLGRPKFSKSVRGEGVAEVSFSLETEGHNLAESNDQRGKRGRNQTLTFVIENML